ncbi:MAG: N-acetyl-alpha-D-glucosaminyl L-malate synthase [Calditrichaeota bacterium]|nr:N-acetyl-alpha-D-glucosaminyl L-malate synthase [Calditrichota bacterium]
MNARGQDRLRIGIVCYPTTGGSGVVATELAHALADRGHEVHVVSYSVPVRLDTLRANLRFHPVRVPDYPLFEYPPYSLALAAQLAEVICRYELDVLHVHYAIPHAISGWLARRISGRAHMPLVTTLHGTDITIIGKDASYMPVTRFSLEQSDAVTVVSRWLGNRVVDVVKCECEWQVVYNFVDGDRYRPRDDSEPRPFGGDPSAPVIMHMSNFRPVKRVGDVIDTFLRVRERMHAQLVLIGAGPELGAVRRQVEESPYAGDVFFLGPQSEAERLLPFADVFLMPSDAEAFGLAALEAMACGVPVIGYNTGGLVEVVRSGIDGFLGPVGDTEAMAGSVLRLFADRDLFRRISASARRQAVTMFDRDDVVNRYEAIYLRAIADVHSRAGNADAQSGSGTPCDDLVKAATE